MQDIQKSDKPVNSYIIFDWETGGLDPKKNAVVSLAAIAIRGDNFEEIDRIDTFVKPYGNYNYVPQAMQINGATQNDLDQGMDIKELVKQIINLFIKASFTKRKDALPILVAHNVLFDWGFLQQVFDYCKQDISKYIQGKEDYYGNFIPLLIDTVIDGKRKWNREDGEIKDYKLPTCCAKAGVDLVDGHRALNDTIALKELFTHFTTCLRSQSSQGPVSQEARFRHSFQF